MAQMRKLMHIDAIIDASIVYELMTLLDGKSMNLSLRPVKHGGEGENGELKARPSGREFILAYASSHDTFAIKDALKEGERVGLSKGSIYAATTAAVEAKALRRIGVGTYALSKKAERAVGKMSEIAKGAKPRRGPGAVVGTTGITGKIMEIIRTQQNGSGEGVPLSVIKDGIRDAGLMNKSNNISPMITDLLKAKMLVRVGKGAYRARVEA